MRLLKSDQYQLFVSAKPAAAIHFDAEWDKNLRTETRLKMLEAEAALGEKVNFGEVDADADADGAIIQSISKGWNVPLVVYYRDGQLVAALIGVGQNVRDRVERVLRGEPIGYKDGTSSVRRQPTDP